MAALTSDCDSSAGSASNNPTPMARRIQVFDFMGELRETLLQFFSPMRPEGRTMRTSSIRAKGLVAETLDSLRVSSTSEEHTSELQSLRRHSYAVFSSNIKTTNYLTV